MGKVIWHHFIGLYPIRKLEQVITVTAFLAVLLLMRRFARNLERSNAKSVKPKANH